METNNPDEMTQEQNPKNRDMSEFQHRITPERITSLGPNEIFVFGSNLQGMHGGGAARIAVERFDAIMGQGVGLQGQSYAIPTMQGGVDTIKHCSTKGSAFLFILRKNYTMQNIEKQRIALDNYYKV